MIPSVGENALKIFHDKNDKDIQDYNLDIAFSDDAQLSVVPADGDDDRQVCKNQCQLPPQSSDCDFQLAKLSS